MDGKPSLVAAISLNLPKTPSLAPSCRSQSTSTSTSINNLRLRSCRIRPLSYPTFLRHILWSRLWGWFRFLLFPFVPLVSSWVENYCDYGKLVALTAADLQLCTCCICGSDSLAVCSLLFAVCILYCHTIYVAIKSTQANNPTDTHSRVGLYCRSFHC